MFQHQTSFRVAKRNRTCCWRRARHDSSPGLAGALLEIASRRYGMFLKKFGRDPKPDEPLFFDPACELPTLADASEIRRQVIDAARDARVNADLVLEFLRLKEVSLT